MSGPCTTALGYVRVSTGEQARSGLGLAAQRAAIVRYCQLHEFELHEILEDQGVSGSRPMDRRVGGGNLLHLCRQPYMKGIHLVLAKLDRAFRSAKDALNWIEEWTKMGMTIHLVDLGIEFGPSKGAKTTKQVMAQLFLTITATFAELEGAMISERTKAALATKKKLGYVIGGVPFGFDRAANGMQVPNPVELATLGRLLELNEKEIQPSAICSILTEERRDTKNKVPWRRQYVQNFLDRIYKPENEAERVAAIRARKLELKMSGEL